MTTNDSTYAAPSGHFLVPALIGIALVVAGGGLGTPLITPVADTLGVSLAGAQWRDGGDQESYADRVTCMPGRRSPASSSGLRDHVASTTMSPRAAACCGSVTVRP
ncbi:hypothetical protein [Streptomyces sp. NPDC058695]|uniref:hypothetical protein n=1 Tax=Streptomyces sp. NPDC058695 TaxID=3346604 RepID=UPI00364C2E67